MNKILISEEELEHFIGEIRNRFRTENSQFGYVVDIDSTEFGKEFSWYLLFYHWPDLVRFRFPCVSEAELFYNAYYWFRVYSHTYMKIHGRDAGLEQQAFRLLEQADRSDENVDWILTEQLDEEARKRADCK